MKKSDTDEAKFFLNTHFHLDSLVQAKDHEAYFNELTSKCSELIQQHINEVSYHAMLNRYQDSYNLFELTNEELSNYKIKYELLNGQFYANGDQIDQAISSFNRARVILESNYTNENKQLQLVIYQHLGNLCSEQFRYREAIENIHKSFEFENKNEQKYATQLSLLAKCYEQVNNFSNAEKYFEEAIEKINIICAKNNDENDILNRHNIYDSYFNYSVRRNNLKRSKELLDQLSQFIDQDYTSTKHQINRAKFLMLADKNKEAKKTLFDLLNKKHLDEDDKKNIYILLLKIGASEDEKVKSNYHSIIDSAFHLINYNDTISFDYCNNTDLKYLVKLLSKAIDLYSPNDKAFKYAQALYQCLAISRSNIITDTDKTFSGATFKKYYDQIIHTAYQSNDHNAVYHYIKEAKFYALENTRFKKKKYKNTYTPSQQDSLQQFNATISFLSKELNIYPDSAGIGTALNNTRTIKRKFQNAIEDEKILTIKNNIPNVFKKAADQLEEYQCLLDYYISDNHIYCIYIDGQTQKVSQKKITADLKAFITDVKTKDSDYEKHLMSVSRLLLPKINFKKNIIIGPHGILNYVPFDVLKDKENIKLLSKHAISYNYSFSEEQKIKRSTNNLSIFGMAPSFDTLCSELAFLDYNQDELNNIKTSFKNLVILGEHYYNRDSLLSKIKGCNIFHLASHSIIDNSNDHNSYLSLGETCISDSTTNKIFIHEIIPENLNNELIVLSSCDSGHGNQVTGEGVASLSNALFSTNVKSIISTLWAANDKSTSMLMGYLYKHLKDGKSKDEALQLAKLDYLDQVSTTYAHPYYWAGFIAIGDMSPIASQQYPVLYLVIGSCLIFFGLFKLIK
ncbi:MAG: CHAT domain-containing protein [Bacteroidia bacterium]|nr:CHAT domain-containing protein [Bacteroidia bacterium]